MNKIKTIPTILGVLLLTIGIGVGVFFVSQPQTFKLQATPEQAPKGVRVTNITEQSFTVSWKTDNKTVGYLKYGPSEKYGELQQENIGSPSPVHHITIANLAPKTTYFFSINSEGEEYDNNGIPWQVTTAPPLTTISNQILASGKIVDQSTTPVGNAIVYLTAPGLSPLSTTTSQNGEWVIPLSKARTTDLTENVNLDSQIIEIFVEAGSLGLATAQINFENINPTPNIVLGRIHKFETKGAAKSAAAPQASLELPKEEQIKSGFDSALSNNVLGVSDQTPVTLDSIENQETIFTNNPEFFGDGPEGIKLTITVESEPITDTINVDQSGSWRWSPPTDLEDGNHHVTLSWRDASGILRTLTRSFTVYAQEEPAFESTPSGGAGGTGGTDSIAQATTPSPSPTVAPTATPKPSATPTASPKSSVTPKPSVSPSISPSPSPKPADLPDAGTTTPTLIFLMMGAILLGVGVVITSKT